MTTITTLQIFTKNTPIYVLERLEIPGISMYYCVSNQIHISFMCNVVPILSHATPPIVNHDKSIIQQCPCKHIS